MVTQLPIQDSVAADAAALYMKDLSQLALRLDSKAAGRTVQEVAGAILADRTVFVAGNGGSASTASHVACDLIGTSRAVGHPRARVVGLADNVAVLTALSNDVSYEEAFAQQLQLQASAQDLLLILSVSGESPNLVQAASTARTLGMRVIAWVGVAGSTVEKYCDACISVGSDDYGLAEDLHLALNHVVSRVLSGGNARRYCPDASPAVPWARPALSPPSEMKAGPVR
ncbi:SIS domain-containing protein [Streptomyces sp. NPDC102384]|uniref:SIS domain-containing protein n=1 Tax=Streptomyces sp. NPDC102384 TaxID=3366166 RepID=UPI00380663B4